jgi:GR25 family glycosyltransferase involved in LPS biosynthesis
MQRSGQHFYINLENRKEKDLITRQELKKLGIKKPNRFNAIKHEIPLVGCAMSHIACIEKAKELNWDYVIVFEDDIKIEGTKTLISKFNKFIKYDFDILYLGCWNYVKPIQIEKDLARVVKAACNHAYVIKSHYYDTYLKNLKDGIKFKLQEPENGKYNIDEYHDILQQKDRWYCITPIHITQKDGWSDNFNEVRNYSKIIKHIPQ